MEEGKLPHFDPDFEPQSRPRSCTWPLPRPDISPVKAEEADGSESAEGILPTEEPKQVTPQVLNQPDETVISKVEGGVTTGVGGATPRKGSSRRNAWGNQSYADLISQAIETSPEQRLTLSQIYDWVVKTVPYFNDKGDSNSSAGWKNSIRHNLSLHNRFVRVHNEATGKSSWWMLNPEGGKSGRAASRHRAASLDNSGKLLKSRVRAKQAKKQQQQVATVGAASGLGGTGSVALQGEGGVDAESSGPSQPLPKWGLNGNGSSPSPRGSLDDPDMWTGFRQRSSSNASTLSGRFSPAAPAPEDEVERPEDRLLGGFSAGGVPDTLAETLMEELDLIDGLTLITAQQQGGASSCSSAMAAPLVPRGASIPPLRSSQPSMSPQTSSQTGTGPPILQGASSSLNFGNSLFNSMPDAGSLVEDYRALLPSCLEFLLSSDTLPPLSDVMMSQVDPLMPGLSKTGLLGLSEGRGTSSQLSLEKDLEQNFMPPMTLLQRQQPKPQLGMGILPAALAQESPTKVRLVPGLSNLIGGPHFDGGLPSTSENRGLHGTGQYGDPGFLPPCQDRLPTDLDIEMFTENLDCDVDYIINSDLMDGETYDFNFDPHGATSQSGLS